MTQRKTASRRPKAEETNDLTAMTSAFWNSLQALQHESLEFLHRRLEHDGQLMKRLSGCADMAELLEEQRTWAAEAGQAYADHGRKIMALITPHDGGHAKQP